MEITQEQRTKIKKVAKLVDFESKGAVSLLEDIFELGDMYNKDIPELRELIEELKKERPDRDEIKEMVDEIVNGIEIRTPKDGEDYVLTEDDKKEIASLIEVPRPKPDVIIEKYNTKTIIKEQPIEIIKEVAVITDNEITSRGEAIRDGLELLQGEERLDKSAIKGLDEMLKSEVRTVFTGVKGIKEVIAGNDITVDNTNLGYPVVSANVDLSGFVPYTGATTTVDLGQQHIKFEDADENIFLLGDPGENGSLWVFGNDAPRLKIPAAGVIEIYDDINLGVYGITSSTFQGGEVTFGTSGGYFNYSHTDGSPDTFRVVIYDPNDEFGVTDGVSLNISPEEGWYLTDGSGTGFAAIPGISGIYRAGVAIAVGDAGGSSFGITTLGTDIYGTNIIFNERSRSSNSGTALLPSHTPEFDTNTGVWYPAADTFAISTAGTERIRISNTGLVGINITPTSTLHTNGSTAGAYRAITALRTLDVTDYLINCTANTFTVTLPTAVGITGRTYIIKNSGTGIITLATTSSQTIDGVASGIFTLVQWDSITVTSNGANWIITN